MKNERMKLIANLVWYSGIAVSSILLIVIVMMNLAAKRVIKNEFFNTPITVTVNDYSYKLGVHFFEVRRFGSMSSRYVNQELGFFFAKENPFFDEAIKELYNYDYRRIRNDYSSERLKTIAERKLETPFAKPFFYDLNPLRISSYEYVPEVLYGFSIMLIMVLTFFLIIIRNLKLLINNYASEGSFTNENATLVKFIGFYFLIGELIRVAIVYWINSAIAKTEWVNSVQQSYSLSVNSFNYALIFAGIVLLVISKILASAAIIKQENDLTV